MANHTRYIEGLTRDETEALLAAVVEWCSVEQVVEALKRLPSDARADLVAHLEAQLYEEGEGA